MTHSFSISPLLQEQMLYLGQKEVYDEGSKTFEVLLQLEVNASQIRRVVKYYGNQKEVERIIESPHEKGEKPKRDGKEIASILYNQIDGSNIPTEEDWKEVKLGRIFTNADVKVKVSKYEGVMPRTRIEKSDYIAHKSNYVEFTKHYEILLNERIKQGYDEIIFITDGEPWMENWLKQNYNGYTRILDFYHALKPIKEFAKLSIPSDEKREKWIREQKELLLNSKSEEVINNVTKKRKLNTKAKEKKESLKRYYSNNKHRMDYKKYRENGWFIGSGAIESAHRNVIQKRMKLCGQRWGNGTQAMLNLRAIYKSNKWNKIIQLINELSFRKSA